MLAVAAATLGLAYAGSPERLPAGVRIAGVDVGKLTPADATRLLERRARSLARVPVLFTAGERTFAIRPSRLGVRVDWEAAVALARREGDGFAPFRGIRRLGVRVFGADVTPPTHVYEPALRHELDRLARAVGRPHRDAELRLRGLEPFVVSERSGTVLDRHRAAELVVRALAGFGRAPVELPVRRDRPTVTAARLRAPLIQARIAVSAPVELHLRSGVWRLPRWRIAQFLELPHGGSRTLRIGGPYAERFLGALAASVDRAPRDAEFAVDGARVDVIPARVGRRLDERATARNILRAALSRDRRSSRIVVHASAPERTTHEAQAMGIKGIVGSYETTYGGEPNRIHNVQLVARLIDGHLIPPGATFSFNRATGARTAEKGFREAPVIINGELENGLGGGVCQVSTTVFNAAYEAGLAITARTNHALYISHYPLGRDATVNYPDLDLRFVNDTPNWLLLRTFVGSSSLVVNLYGTPVNRRVVSDARPLVETGAPPVRAARDPSLAAGRRVVDDAGQPSRATSVRRRVYAADGRLLHDDTWTSSYQAEPQLVRVGTKPKPKPDRKRKPKPGTGSAADRPRGDAPTPRLAR